MDLRPYVETKRDEIPEICAQIENGVLFYQPFIFDDDLRVGEGFNFVTEYRHTHSIFENNVLAGKGVASMLRGKAGNLLAEEHHDTFIAANNRLWQEYLLFYDRIESRAGGVAGKQILELGSNNGLTLFHFATKGGICTGLDWNDYTDQYALFNRLLDVDVKLVVGDYDNLRHRFETGVAPRDIVINTIFMNHQSDPVHLLCYLADICTGTLALWLLLNHDDEPTIRFEATVPIHDFGKGKPFPLCIHNSVTISRPLLEYALVQLGFEDYEIFPPTGGPLTGFTQCIAKRTSDRRSAFLQVI